MKKPANPLGLYLRNGIWWTSWRFDGRRIRISLNTRIEDEATRLAMQARGRPVAYVAHGMRQHVADYIRSGGKSEGDRKKKRPFSEATAYHRERDLLRFIESAEIETMSDLTEGALSSWFGAERDRVALATAAQRLKHVSIFCSWLVREGKLKGNVCERLMEKVEDMDCASVRTDFLTAVQVDRLIAAAPSDDLRFALLAGFDAGLRVGEIIASRVHWIVLKEDGTGTLWVKKGDGWKPKSRRDRMVPLTRRFASFLSSYLAGRAGGEYVLRPDILAASPATRLGMAAKTLPPPRFHLASELVDFFTSQGLPDMRSHAMRRTFAALRISAGVSLYKVARWLGDREKTAETHYAHLARVDEDVDRVHRST